ncbi:UDP-N-acetylenolpyruvoylglucosamine reductase [Armatimonadota bacterium]|nr:UDP-N-acetylenolpyruvoylglucosamine reductase [Armatimonadota bacterium]
MYAPNSPMATITTWGEAIHTLPAPLQNRIQRNQPLHPYTTLRVGGEADFFLNATHRDEIALVASLAQRYSLPFFLLGEGSNVCVSDRGVRGFVLRNRCQEAEVGETTRVDAGHNFMRLFVKTLQAGLSGLEFAVGIPGTVGGALVSNAGAYRANICDLVRSVEVVEAGERKVVSPEWMEFSYRDSCLRRNGGKPAVVLATTLQLTPAAKTAIRLKAKDFQYQRILKQPWEPSAGSFFKNVNDKALADSLPTLPAPMKSAGVVPTAHLSEACGLKGFQVGGAAVSPRHANFIVNRGGAGAADIRAVAEEMKMRVFERFGVRIEEEALYVGEWE